MFDLQKAELSILFVNNKQMHKLNKRHREIDSTTDVLSFPMYESIKDIPKNSECLLGDIAVNLELVLERLRELMPEARAQCQEFNDEVANMLIHGFLHLLGYDHEKSAYQAKRMKEKELELANVLREIHK
ncbi:Uncharacterized protein MCHI_000448 [Candidatus Magnetoovum chiemensis]|nr:Uncharacterized protein MCHI_000448 [Candidatus Magnetoovum chiemensis]